MTQSEPSDPHRQDSLSPETIHALRTPLTVIRAQSQMVARWLRRLDHPDGDRVLARLTMIDAMIRQVADHLDTLSQPADDEAADRDAPRR